MTESRVVDDVVSMKFDMWILFEKSINHLQILFDRLNMEHFVNVEKVNERDELREEFKFSFSCQFQHFLCLVTQALWPCTIKTHQKSLINRFGGDEEFI